MGRNRNSVAEIEHGEASGLQDSQGNSNPSEREYGGWAKTNDRKFGATQVKRMNET